MLSQQLRSGASSAVHLIAGFILLSLVGTASAQTADRVINEQQAADNSARVSQQRVNALDDQAQKMLDEYRAAVRETKSLQQYNEQLSAQVQSQTEEVGSIQQQLEQIETTNREVYPMMQKMLATLESFVKLDAPFLPKERETRIAELKDMMSRADVTTAEKYRRLLEAYSVEMEYGRTIESYQGPLPGDQGNKQVDFLRVGRVALMYQTLDGEETGYWDEDAKSWVVDDGFHKSVTQGLRIAKKQAAPDLIIIPVHAPQEAK
ncbi:DUF3450 domain-containing protein [Algiphilus sp. W345]|uniref:DUF3450 domain-containing protein n=1 Tax=Banduia mediterranea TaxID=3075609 RepID=A0ABU2WIW3_9GAMM|nr:DUF3450 domain-containing protein [Algiphilus sp. W345]MDT0497795.1 DUF3450 domain-containing protein [Algiphilus sp. W345]